MTINHQFLALSILNWT